MIKYLISMILYRQDYDLQALTNQILSDVRSRPRVLHYLFVNVLP